MNTVLSITVVTVALLCAYSTQVRCSDSLSEDKHVTEARGDMRETESTQGKLEAALQFENTKPKLEVTEHVTEQLKESTIKSGAPKQESGYMLTFPTGRYQKWSNWSKCDPIECVESRRRECVDQSWMQSDVNRSGARRCSSRYYEETRDCKDKTTCVTYGMLENCGVQTTKEDTAFNPIGAERTTPNSWPWLVRVIASDPEGKEDYFCSGTLISPKLIVIAAHCFIDNGLVVNSGQPMPAVLSKNRTLFAYLGSHRSSGNHENVEKYLIETMFVNFYYDTFKISKGHDMALLQLAKPADLNKEINYACIATQPIEFKHGTQCYAVGWGQTPSSFESNTEIKSFNISHGPFNSDDTDADYGLSSKFNKSEPVELQEIVLPYMSASKCLKYYPKHRKESQICAGWNLKDSCERDCRSGLYCKIPYTNKWLLAGVRNYGTETECKPGTGIYTSALTRNEWLFSTADRFARYMSLHNG